MCITRDDHPMWTVTVYSGMILLQSLAQTAVRPSTRGSAPGVAPGASIRPIDFPGECGITCAHVPFSPHPGVPRCEARCTGPGGTLAPCEPREAVQAGSREPCAHGAAQRPRLVDLERCSIRTNLCTRLQYKWTLVDLRLDVRLQDHSTLDSASRGVTGE